MSCGGCPEPIAGSTEAARLGFTEAVIPAPSRDARDQVMTVHAGMLVHAVSTVQQALGAVGLMPPERERRDIRLHEESEEWSA